jgi:hypothetical protein
VLNFHKNQSNNAENIRDLIHPWYNLGFCFVKGSIGQVSERSLYDKSLKLIIEIMVISGYDL